MLCLSWAQLPAALRIAQEREPDPGIAGVVHESEDIVECGSSGTLEWLGYAELNDTDPPTTLLERRPVEPDRRPETLDHTQWCGWPNGRELVWNNRVALMMIGEAFRAKDFFRRAKLDCSNPSLSVQKKLAENHIQSIVEPIESLGMLVDIYLTVTPCSSTTQKALTRVQGDFNNSETLRSLYGSRVKDVFEFEHGLDMYSRLADAHLRLHEAMNSSTYEYFIMWRYDVFLDRSFTELLPSEARVRGGLSFYMSAHDFAWSFPGEMWTCMKEFWDSCMRKTNVHNLEDVGWRERTQLGCFDMGPFHLSPWVQGYAFDRPLQEIERVVNWQGAKPRVNFKKAGTSGFDEHGEEHRCKASWFWPPKSSWEHRFMPCYYHVG